MTFGVYREHLQRIQGMRSFYAYCGITVHSEIVDISDIRLLNMLNPYRAATTRTSHGLSRRQFIAHQPVALDASLPLLRCFGFASSSAQLLGLLDSSSRTRQTS